MRKTKAFSTVIEECEEKAKTLAEELSMFSEGVRLIMLLHRTKDGGHNKESRRASKRFLYRTPEEFKTALFEAVLAQTLSGDKYRIYLSVNARDVSKSVFYLEQCLLDAHHGNSADMKNDLYQKVFFDSRAFLMQPAHRATKLFLLDIDDVEGMNRLDVILSLLGKHPEIEELLRRRTRNGWHIITNPFNPALLNGALEIKKDALIYVC